MGKQDTADRLAFYDNDTLLPEMSHLGHTMPRTANTYGLDAHTHSGWEICWLRRGSVDWWVEGDGLYRVPAGSFFMTQPHERHGGLHDLLTPCDLYWCIINLPLQHRWPGLSRQETDQRTNDLRSVQARVFPAIDGCEMLWTQLLDEHAHRDAYSATTARALLHQLLTLVLRSAHNHHQQTPTISPEIQAAMDRGRAHILDGIGVPALARTAGLSASRFHARFVAEVGESPADWLRRRRVDLAKVRLSTTTDTITDIALSLRFPSSQHFATVFRKYVGLTPGHFRQQTCSSVT